MGKTEGGRHVELLGWQGTVLGHHGLLEVHVPQLSCLPQTGDPLLETGLYPKREVARDQKGMLLLPSQQALRNSSVVTFARSPDIRP